MAQVLVTLTLVLVAVACLSAVTVAVWTTWRRSTSTEMSVARISPTAALASGTRTPRPALPEDAATQTEPELFDRVVRVMTLIFLASVGVYVFVGGEFRDNEVAIQVLLAGGMLSVVLLQDLLPAGLLGRARYPLEACVSILFIGALTGLTGGLGSPFVIGFFLVVGGASLSLSETPPILIALLAAGVYALVGVAVAPLEQLNTPAVVHLIFIVITLGLLAYLASVVGREQRRIREAALSLSRFDSLTGLYNRAYFFSVLDREIRRAARSGGRFAVLMLDLDDLKPVNDTFGHQRGDALLRAVSETIGRNVRGSDLAARYGGDEFVILLSDTTPEGAHMVAEKLRTDISSLSVGPGDRPARTSASFGLVHYPEDGTSMDSLIADADSAMYESKRRGKNQIVGYTTRIERVVTAMGDPRTTTISHPTNRQTIPQEPLPRSAAPSSATPTRSQMSVPGPGSPSAAQRPQARLAPAAQPTDARPFSTDPARRPTWDSTAPGPQPGGASAARSRPADAGAYVVFPIEPGQPVERPAPRPNERDFTAG